MRWYDNGFHMFNTNDYQIPHSCSIIPLSFHYLLKHMRYNTIIETNTTLPTKGSIIMKKTYITSAMIMALALASMTGCGDLSVSQNTSSTAKTATSVPDTKESITAEKSTEYSADESDEAIEVKQLSNETEETTYTQRDLEQTADTSEAQNITVADNKTIDITDEGVYTISGSAAVRAFPVWDLLSSNRSSASITAFARLNPR